MLKLDTQPRPPVRVDLPGGAFIEFRPLTSAGIVSGRRVAREVQESGADSAVAGVGFTIACARWGAIAWGGVADEAGQDLELSADSVQLLLEQSEDALLAIQVAYIFPALATDAEKNGSAPARDGTSRAPRKPIRKAKAPGVGASTAKDAKKTARRPATSARRS